MSDQFMSEDLVKTKITYRELFKRLWPYARKEKGLLIVALFAVIGVAVVWRMIPLVIGYAIDHGVLKKDAMVFTNIAFVYLGLEIMRSCCSLRIPTCFKFLEIACSITCVST